MKLLIIFFSLLKNTISTTEILNRASNAPPMSSTWPSLSLYDLNNTSSNELLNSIDAPGLVELAEDDLIEKLNLTTSKRKVFRNNYEYLDNALEYNYKENGYQSAKKKNKRDFESLHRYDRNLIHLSKEFGSKKPQKGNDAINNKTISLNTTDGLVKKYCGKKLSNQNNTSIEVQAVRRHLKKNEDTVYIIDIPADIPENILTRNCNLSVLEKNEKKITCVKEQEITTVTNFTAKDEENAIFYIFCDIKNFNETRDPKSSDNNQTKFNNSTSGFRCKEYHNKMKGTNVNSETGDLKELNDINMTQCHNIIHIDLLHNETSPIAIPGSLLRFFAPFILFFGTIIPSMINFICN